MDAEHRKLLVAIRAATNEHGRSEPPERLTLRAHVPNRFDPSGGGAGDGYSSMGGRGGGTFGGRTLTVKLYLTYDGPGAIHEVWKAVRQPWLALAAVYMFASCSCWVCNMRRGSCTDIRWAGRHTRGVTNRT